MNLVVIESPFAGANAAELDRNQRYLSAALQDCLHRGEAPFASHAIYTRAGVLDDTVAEERKLGIEAGFAWRLKADYTVVYEDLGISPGMRAGIEHAESIGQDVSFRSLKGWRKTTAQDVEYERDFWQAKAGALLSLIDAVDVIPTTHDGRAEQQAALRALQHKAYAVVNTRRPNHIDFEEAKGMGAYLVAAMAREKAWPVLSALGAAGVDLETVLDEVIAETKGSK